MAASKTPNFAAKTDARRSTRVVQNVPVTISSRNEVGTSFLESTSTLALNCHGCLYPSKNEYQPGSWVTLDLVRQADGKPYCLRAQVRFVRRSRNPNEPYHVGVELQTPANVWGINGPPVDWLRFPDPTSEKTVHVLPESAEIASETFSPQEAETTRQAPDASSGWTMRATPDEVKGTFDAKLQRAAQRAVSLVVTSQVSAAVAEAVKQIESFSQAAVRDAERHCLAYRENLITFAREQLESSLAEAQETAQRLEKSSSEVHLVLAEALTFLQETARELGKEFTKTLEENGDRAAAAYHDKTAQFSGQCLARLVEQVQAATGEAMARVEGRSAEATTQLERLNSLVAETQREFEAHGQVSRGELARARDLAVQEFRQRAEEVWNSSLATAMSVVNEHSRNVLDALSKEPAQRLQPANRESFSR